MKKIIVITGILLLAFSGVKAQQLINGEKAPELKLSEWISKNQLQSGKPTLIEFFFSRSDLSMKRLPTVDDFARNYGKKLNVVVIGCETKDKIQSVMDGKDMRSPSRWTTNTRRSPPTERSSSRTAFCSMRAGRCSGSAIRRNSAPRS